MTAGMVPWTGLGAGLAGALGLALVWWFTLGSPLVSGWLASALGVPARWAEVATAGLASGSLLLSAWVLVRLVRRLVSALRTRPAGEVLVGAGGLLGGLAAGALVTHPLNQWEGGRVLAVALTLAGAYLGVSLAVARWQEWWPQLSGGGTPTLPGRYPGPVRSQGASRVGGPGRAGGVGPASGWSRREGDGLYPGCKLLDTSVIIDGRIADICRTGFLEGVLLVPGFVLRELQRIADSSDMLRRNRGRRGLEILNQMRKESPVPVQVLEVDDDDTDDVDAKLVRLAKALGAKVVTNDFNLNKVAELHGVPVLNIHELANTVKPLVLPGEEMVVHVVRDGKEQGQGVGYLEDGTMIVIDGGRKYIGESVGVLVTSVLQTAAGRMIFAKPKPVEKAL